jgi:hypothetical protein
MVADSFMDDIARGARLWDIPDWLDIPVKDASPSTAPRVHPGLDEAGSDTSSVIHVPPNG